MVLECYRKIFNVFKTNEISFDDDGDFENSYGILFKLFSKGILEELTDDDIALAKTNPDIFLIRAKE